jgi:hypothetical protein
MYDNNFWSMGLLLGRVYRRGSSPGDFNTYRKGRVVTTKLRWYVTSNKVTREQIEDYRKTADVTLMEAKRILEDWKEPRLQYLLFGGEMSHARWVDVPTEYGPNE